MPHSLSVPSSGLQALILCGPGSSFPTFTSNPDEHPKALLPIANRPMVWYPIEFCHRMGITSITLICPPSASAAMTTALKTNPDLTRLPLPRPDILFPRDLDYVTGTAEIFRLPEVKSLITSDFVVLPCDLVCELGGDLLLQAWMVQSASLTDKLSTSGFANGPSSQLSGGLGVWFDTKASNPIKGEETDFLATTSLDSIAGPNMKGSLFSQVSNLVTSLPTDSLNDIMEDRKGFSVRHSLLRAHPRVRMFTNHRDAHIYIFPRWVLDFIQENERLESLGEDVVGWWAKAGWQDGLADKMHMKKIIDQDKDHDTNDSSGESAMTPRESSPGLAKEEAYPTVALSNVHVQARPTIDLSERVARREASFKAPPILAYTHSKKLETDALIRRVDTAQLLLATSLQLAKIPSLEEMGAHQSSPYAHAKKVAYPEGVKPRTTITKQDSLVAENVTVEEKTAIKESVVGANCQIKEGAKLMQCLLMEGVVVGKNCKLTKCILGKRCVIGDGSVLTECEVQENLLVEAKTEDKNNKLMSSEGLEATEAEMEEVLQEREDQETDTETETEAETETTADDTGDDTASEA